ncbi:MAG: flagellin [Phycisphaeraceae bacterium]
MSTIPSSLARTSTAMTSDSMMSNLRRTHLELLRVQTELATGQRVNKPSDAPESVGLIKSMQHILAQFEKDKKALDTAGNTAAMADQSLAEISELINQASSIASSQIGIGSDAETRKSEAAVIQSLIDTVTQVGNTKFQDVYLFGGEQAATQPFVEHLGGIEYLGSHDPLTQNIGNSEYALNASGAGAFGALSTQVQGKADLDVQATGETRIRDLEGARGLGTNLGSVRVTVNGTTTDVDLRGVERLSDVTDRINNVLGTAGDLSVTADGFSLTAEAGETIAIADIGTGITAADLGLNITADDDETIAGGAINPRLTQATQLTDLGAAIDWAGGLKITNGGNTRVIDFSAADTVEDMMNVVDQADIGVRLEINDAGTGFNLINAVSGTNLSVGENAGGTTATDLGLRSYAGDTELADLNHGKGVRRENGENDLRISMGDGATSFEVNLDGLTTVQQAIDAIDAAAAGAGLAPGDLTVALASDGNGLTFTSALAAGDPFQIQSINGSRAAEDLGINKAVAGSTLAGDDVAQIRTDSVLTHMMMLRDALLNNDEQKITEAGEYLGVDVGKIAGVRAQQGVRAQAIESEKNRIDQRGLQTESMLSDLQDSDYSEAVTRFTKLQQQLQATMMSGQQLMQTSLLDFLR